MDQALDEQLPMEFPNANGSSITSPADGDFQQPQAFKILDLTSAQLNGKTPTKQQLEGRLEAGKLEGEKSNSHQTHTLTTLQFDQIESPISLDLNDCSGTPEYRSVLYLEMIECNNQSTFTTEQMNASCYSNSLYSAQDRNPTQYLVNTQGLLRAGEDSLSGFPIRSDITSPDGWITLCSPSHQGPKYDHPDEPNHK
jgi:hypothetical protein